MKFAILLTTFISDNGGGDVGGESKEIGFVLEHWSNDEMSETVGGAGAGGGGGL